MPDDEKRSSTHEATEPSAAGQGHVHHPGGSAEQADLPPAGAGYLDGCIYVSRPSGADPRLAELREIGLDRRWLAVARTIGVDSFLAAWKVLDEFTDETGETRMCIHRFREWRRVQRNREIRRLDQEGYSSREIRTEIQRRFRESLSKRHIDRIIAAGKIAA